MSDLNKAVNELTRTAQADGFYDDLDNPLVKENVEELKLKIARLEKKLERALAYTGKV